MNKKYRRKFAFTVKAGDSFWDSSVDELTLPVSCMYVLMRQDIFTLKDLAKHLGDLEKYKNCGESKASHIRASFFAYCMENEKVVKIENYIEGEKECQKN